MKNPFTRKRDEIRELNRRLDVVIDERDAAIEAARQCELPGRDEDAPATVNIYESYGPLGWQDDVEAKSPGIADEKSDVRQAVEAAAENYEDVVDEDPDGVLYVSAQFTKDITDVIPGARDASVTILLDAEIDPELAHAEALLVDALSDQVRAGEFDGLSSWKL